MGGKVYYSRCFPKDTRDRFGAELAALLRLELCPSATDHTDLNIATAEIACFINGTAATLHIVIHFSHQRIGSHTVEDFCGLTQISKR